MKFLKSCRSLIKKLERNTHKQNAFIISSVRYFNTDSTEKKYIPRRSLMYIPGHDIKKLQKVPKLNTDCAVLECEDGVALNMKAQARENVCKVLDTMEFGITDIAVRINSVSSGLYQDDLNVILSATNLPQTILLPKVDYVEELQMFTNQFQAVLKDKNIKNYQPYLITYVESAIGIMNLRDTLNAATQHTKEGIYHIDGVVFGSDDFCADIGATRSSEGSEIMFARQQVVMTAKAYKLQAIDMVSIDLKDMESLKRQSLEGARMGYTGKQIIHPNQVPVVNEAFTPSTDKIEWATELIQAFEHHQETGKGAFTFQGHMIDMPLLLQAKNILQLVRILQRSTYK
ncbi:hypothetical protein LOTGIDRAFT_127794 [Lottia gigantea]|uniref:Citramalyl-CoA lyase, mitochondrial n=1 Tax=Lottia gigantea TaxID=225164 RepID=V4BEZ1_LOTGI|nr:hypothetical protein LOTGIDRAFT_127794 [Lottia gigantea]ESO87404.1 hypothetical protein LOTGIDRAFT_127794 [Lottia gigantea]